MISSTVVLEPVPVVVFLVLLGAEPEQVGDDAAEPAQEEQLHHEAAGIDLADGRLAQVAFSLLGLRARTCRGT